MFRDEILGNSKRNLVLKTAGVIRVLVGDRYYDLDFRSENKNNNETDSSSSNDDIVIVSNESVFNDSSKYPGDGKIVFTLNGNIYYTSGGSLISYTNKDVETYDNTISFKGDIPFIVYSNKMVKNLNANYLDGKTANDFVLKDSNIEVESLTVKNIKASNGDLIVDEGKLVISESNNNLSTPISIGTSIEIVDSTEISSKSVLPYFSTILDDLVEILDRYGRVYSAYIPKMIKLPDNYNSNFDISEYGNLTNPEFTELINSVYHLPWVIRDCDYWSEDIFLDLKNNLADINVLPFNSSSFELSLRNISGLQVYDRFKLELTSEYYVDSNGEKKTNTCEDVTNMSFVEDQIDIECIITKIDKTNNIIYVATDQETIRSKNMVLYSRNFSLFGKEYKYDSCFYEDSSCELYEYISTDIIANENVIGDISDVSTPGFNGTTGLVMKSGCYLYNPHIINNITYINSDSDTFLDVPNYCNFSINSNGYSVILSDIENELNGFEVNIYAISDVLIKYNNVEETLTANTYNTFRYIPIDSESCNWIKIK